MKEIIAGLGGGAGFSSNGVETDGTELASGLAGSLNFDIIGS